MAGEALKKAEATPAAAPGPGAVKKEEEKAVVPAAAPAPPASKSEDKEPTADESKALVVFEKVADKPHAEKNTQRSSNDRDIALAKVEAEKRNSLIKAWEENEKAKAENRASKKLSAILSWENTKKAVIKAQLKKKEEEIERKKAEYAEKMSNKAASIHKEAEEKRAMVMARRGEQFIKADEMAATYRAKGLTPKKILGCFGYEN